MRICSTLHVLCMFTQAGKNLLYTKQMFPDSEDALHSQ